MSSGTSEPGPTVVGRQAEIDALVGAIDRLDAAGEAVFLSGEPGIGKSTLARLAATEAQRRGLPVYWGFAWESGGAPAYWPWTQALSTIAAQQALDDESLAGLAQVLPGRVPARNADLSPEQARFGLLEAVRRLLDDVSRRAPCLLIFEDLHAADADSIRLLQHVARHVPAMPLLLVGTLRPADARLSPDAAALWHSLRSARVLELGRLGESDVRAYLAARDACVDEAMLRTLIETTGGNPLFLAELTEALRQAPDADAATLRLPETVQQVIREQLLRLPLATRDLLDCAAVLGRRFTLQGLAALDAGGDGGIEPALSPALDAEVLRRLSPTEFEFSHVLHRDVLYQSLRAELREARHRRRAASLRGAIERGESDRWAELATHLAAAGDDQRAAAVDAWCEAGRRARDRLAYDEAARLYRRALDTLDAGPRFASAQRVRVLLELADALLVRGDIEAGHERCRAAFDLASALDDPRLMSEAALTYGNVIVVSKIDRDLVAMLAASLARLGDDELALRARVQARLAAARQPARNPAEPMRQAREAIRMARATGDERVVYEVLKSAMSALMDFAPVTERVPLNRESEALAHRFRDTPGRFRSFLRLMSDAAELGDREMLDETINQCERIAERVALPHYQWRIASARAMQATIEGRYARACDLLARAQALADAAGDRNAGLTLPLQRLAILCEWDAADAPRFADVERDLADAFARFPDAELYARPLFASHACLVGSGNAADGLADTALVERQVTGGDRFCLVRLGELAIAAGRRELAERIVAALDGYGDACATMGLMGMVWDGPVATVLGRLATALGDYAAAARHFAVALDVASRMRSPPQLARAHAGLAELAEAQNRGAEARAERERVDALVAQYALRVPAPPPGQTATATTGPAPSVTMSLEGDVWSVAFRDANALLGDTKGLAMLALLLARPDTDIHVLELSGSDAAAVDGGDAGPALDARARHAYRERARDVAEELADAEELGDLGRAEALREELELLSAELSRAFGLGGRARATGRNAERARVNVRRRIKDAIARIEEQLPGAGRYLEHTVKTGTYCRYSPL